MRWLLLLPTLPVYAATFTVSVSPKAAQTVLSYTVPSGASCTIVLTPSPSGAGPSGTPNDVNAMLFSASNIDTSRASTVQSGNHRYVVLGQRTSALAGDGNYYSRALQANTSHSGSLSCGSDSATFSFTTADPPPGDSGPDAVPWVSGPWGNQAWPTMSWSSQNPYVDPLTGLVIERISGPGQSGGSTYSWTYTSVIDGASAWTNPTNVYGNSGYASTAAKGQANALFLPVYNNNGHGFQNEAGVDDMQAYFGSAYTDTSGDTLSACWSRNHGQNCIGNAVTLTLPVGSGSAASVSGPGNYPSPMWSGWGSPQITPEDFLNPTGTVNTSGTTVTLVSINAGTYFPLSIVAGDHITINGTDYTISALVNAQQLSLTTSAGTQSGVIFSLQNFGLMVWNSGVSGTVYARGAVYNEAYSNLFSIGDDGTYNPCSVQTVTVNYAADGATLLGTPETGRVCNLIDISNNPNLYLFIPATGETRLIGYGGVSTFGNIGNGATQTFDPGNANTVYFAQNGSSNPNVYKCTYSGNYAALPPNYTGATSPNWTCTNLTSGTGNDLLSQISNAVSGGVNTSYFDRISGFGPMAGNYISITLQLGQGSIGYGCFFDVTQSAGRQVVACHDSWSTYPWRWFGWHGTFSADTSAGWGHAFGVPLWSQSATGIGLYQMTPTAITGETGTTALTANVATDPTTQNCQTLGVSTSSPWYALGAAGNNCIRVTVPTEPQNVAPSAADLAQWPSACNPNYAQLQTIQPGDYLYDLANGTGNGENFLVAGKTGSGCSSITLVIARGVNQACAYIPQTHSNGFTFVVGATANCDGNLYWYQATNPSMAYVDNSADYLAHSFTGQADSTGTNLVNYQVYAANFGYKSYGVRQGALPALIGQADQYGAQMVYPFNGSTGGIGTSYVQTHPGGQSYLASPNTLGYDGRPVGGAGGGVSTVWYHTLTLVSGNVYQISCPEASLGGSCIDSADPKRLGWAAWAGRFMLHDVSGPSSNILTAAPYTFCYAYHAGECVSGSSAGNRYVNVANATTTGNCIVGALDQNTPCLAAANAEVGNAVQFNWAVSDPNAVNWRRLGYALGGPGQTDNYWNVHGIVDASWAFTEVDWKDGIRKDILAYQLPPWPATDSVNRSQYVQVPIQLSGNTGDTVRIEFGYQEFGAPGSLNCTSRGEVCFTSASATPSNPFVWSSETQSYTSCGSGCTVNVPALPGRVLYYRLHRKNAAGVESVGPIQIN